MDSGTVMFGVIGDPIKQSKSPVMMNRAIRETGLNACYAAFHVRPEQLRDAIAGFRALQFRGINVTIPHKVEVMKYLDEIDRDAEIIGAVNTIVNDNGKLIGFNTDGIGYVRSLREETGFSARGKNILLIGAGGAARGVMYALAKEQPAHIWVANRTIERAFELADSMQAYADCTGMGLDGIENIKHKIDLAVNLTPAGMFPHHLDDLPMDTDWIHDRVTVSDTVYNPLMTNWLNRAKILGAQIHAGLGMLIYQGAYAFEYWTGVDAPVHIMREAVEQSLFQEKN